MLFIFFYKHKLYINYKNTYINKYKITGNIKNINVFNKCYFLFFFPSNTFNMYLNIKKFSKIIIKSNSIILWLYYRAILNKKIKLNYLRQRRLTNYVNLNHKQPTPLNFIKLSIWRSIINLMYNWKYIVIEWN